MKKINQDRKIVPFLGLQWGDEGKGKIVDAKGKDFKLNVRFQGGPNSGHTIIHDGKTYVFHMLPSGVFHNMRLHLASGMVIDPGLLKAEVLDVPEPTRGKLFARLSISPLAKLILPTHILLDGTSEKSKGKGKIGSTGKGIGPAYTDHTNRSALRVGDLYQKDFKKRYDALTATHKNILDKLYGGEYDTEKFTALEKRFWDGVKYFRANIKLADSLPLILSVDGKIIAEGAQGTLLDVTFGDYPYVTSSNTIAGGVATGVGVPPTMVAGAVGVFKAYATRVGEGPFPSEFGGDTSRFWCRDHNQTDEKARFPVTDLNAKDPFAQGVAIRQAGFEFGATTKRLRRTGWLDLVLLNYTVKLNGVTSLAMTKLDIFDGLKQIKVAEKYILEDGTKVIYPPFDMVRQKVTPTYKSFSGWKGKLSEYANKKQPLPPEAVTFIKYIEAKIGVPIDFVSTGPGPELIKRFW